MSWVIGAVVVFLLIGIIGAAAKPAGVSQRDTDQCEPVSKPLPDLPVRDVTGSGEGKNVEVVGESFCQPALRLIGTKGGRYHTEALLWMEGDNPHDDQAVAVYISGSRVGHLSRENARKYRAFWRDAGDFIGRVPAVVVGGGPSGDNFGVWLNARLGGRRPKAQ